MYKRQLKVDGKKVLLVLDTDKNVWLSARNVPDTFIARPQDLNTYSILNNAVIVVTEDSLEVINKL